MSVSAIIVAAGSSRRMGFDKLVAPLDGLPVLKHSIQAFLDCASISEVIVVTDEDRFQLCCPKEASKPVRRVDGGAERHHSVANGLNACSSQATFIAVHDGARPFILPNSIEICLAAAQEHGAATCAHRITETVKRADENDYVASSVDRENLWAMETPQIFRQDLIKDAYAHVLSAGELVTDEVSALESIGIKTKLIAHPAHNPKITFPSDIPS